MSLSRMFGPNLIRPPRIPSTATIDLSKTVQNLEAINKAVQIVLDDPDYFFKMNSQQKHSKATTQGAL
jgi:hypothetical protein